MTGPRWAWDVLVRGWDSLVCRDAVALALLFGVTIGLHVAFWLARRIYERDRR